MNAEWLEKHLAGANVIADTHFEWSTKHLTKVNFVTPIPAPRGRRKKDLAGRPIPKTLSKKNKPSPNMFIKSTAELKISLDSWVKR